MRNAIFNDTEHEYKMELIRELLKEVEGLPDEEIPDEESYNRMSIDGLNKELEEYIGSGLLESW